MQERFTPGTRLATFMPMIEAASGLTLAQVCAITGLEPYTVQNWVKRGFVARPVDKKYFGRQLARLMLISSIKDCMNIDTIGELMSMINGSANDESDDIISEELLYDHFCNVISALPPAAVEEDILRQVVAATMDYEPPGPGALDRLQNALTVMALAYISGQYKRKAEKYFTDMKLERIN